jgi:hypothetical protein
MMRPLSNSAGPATSRGYTLLIFFAQGTSHSELVRQYSRTSTYDEG